MILEPEFLPEGPQSDILSPYGNEADEQRTYGEIEPRPFAESAGVQLNISSRQIERDETLSKCFTEDQLSILGTENVALRDVKRLANLTRDQIADAINLIIEQHSVDHAIAKATNGSPETLKAQKAQQEAELPDKEWLPTYCYQILGDPDDRVIAPGDHKREPKLQDETEYRRAALLYRKIRGEMAIFRAKAKKVVEQSHWDGPNKFTWMLLPVLNLTHPNDWNICPGCLGLNKEHPRLRGVQGVWISGQD